MNYFFIILFVSFSCAYVLVCELDENRLQAEYVLSQIIRVVQESVTSHEQKNAEVSRIRTHTVAYYQCTVEPL